MNTDVENLVLEQLRAIRDELGNLRRGQDEMRQRVSSIERQVANLQGDVALVHQRLDHMVERLARIERIRAIRSPSIRAPRAGLREKSCTPIPPVENPG